MWFASRARQNASQKPQEKAEEPKFENFYLLAEIAFYIVYISYT